MPEELNGAFSKELPSLQLFWDSVSLGSLKKCPRYYQLNIVEGWAPRATRVDLAFGIAMHSSRERFYHARAAGAEHDEAVSLALQFAIEFTWDFELSRPIYWDHPTKTRESLLRSIVWYCDNWKDDPLEQVVLHSGKPAVELSFSFELDLQSTATGEQYSLAGHLDRLVRFNDQVYVSDLKTTKHDLGVNFFSQFTPDNQMSLYSFAADVVYSQPVAGLIVDGVQVLATLTRFARSAPIPRSRSVLDEWQKDLSFWLASAQMYAEQGYWPQNDRACYWCEFRGICSKPPAVREQWLKAEFTKRTWDPTKKRGDI